MPTAEPQHTAATQHAQSCARRQKTTTIDISHFQRLLESALDKVGWGGGCHHDGKFDPFEALFFLLI